MRRGGVLVLSAVLLSSGCASVTGDVGPATTSSPSSASSPSTTALPPAPTPTSSLGPGESWLTLGVADDLPGGVYLPAAPSGGTDDYRCFLVDPHVAATTFLTGVQFLPGNPHIVHHSILFRVEPTQVAAARAKDAADPRPGWQCFGGPGLPSSAKNPLDGLDAAPWLAGWAPGGKETRFPRGFGVQMPAGTQIVIQMHYNLRHATAGTTLEDNTHVRLRTVRTTALQPLHTMLLPAPVEVPCPAGASGRLCDRSASVADVMSRFGEGSGRTIAGLQLLCGGDLVHPTPSTTQSCTRYLRAPVTIRAVAGHMHLLGRSITITTNAGTSREKQILDIPVWDFDRQSATPLGRALSLRRGDTVTVSCTWDPTLRTQLPETRDLPPRYIVWGEGTTDEMCLGILITS
jgi:hypothetical protein